MYINSKTKKKNLIENPKLDKMFFGPFTLLQCSNWDNVCATAIHFVWHYNALSQHTCLAAHHSIWWFHLSKCVDIPPPPNSDFSMTASVVCWEDDSEDIVEELQSADISWGYNFYPYWHSVQAPCLKAAHVCPSIGPLYGFTKKFFGLPKHSLYACCYSLCFTVAGLILRRPSSLPSVLLSNIL